MTINVSEINWALNEVNDPVTSAANKVEPTEGIKNNGLVRDEPLLRDNLNYQFDKYAEFFQNLQDQIDSLTIGSGSALLQQIYHVGSHYFSDDPQNPADRFGFGTWSRIEGRFVVGIDDNDTDFDGVGETGGSKVHNHQNTLSVGTGGSHTHLVSQNWSGSPQQSNGSLPSPTTTNNLIVGSGSSETGERFESLGQANAAQTTSTHNGHTHPISGGINTASNVPPYRTLYWWTRIA